MLLLTFESRFTRRFPLRQTVPPKVISVIYSNIVTKMLWWSSGVHNSPNFAARHNHDLWIFHSNHCRLLNTEKYKKKKSLKFHRLCETLELQPSNYFSWKLILQATKKKAVSSARPEKQHKEPQEIENVVVKSLTKIVKKHRCLSHLRQIASRVLCAQTSERFRRCMWKDSPKKIIENHFGSTKYRFMSSAFFSVVYCF